jgi:hypothetical protein
VLTDGHIECNSGTGDDEQHEALAEFFQEITETKNVKVWHLKSALANL